MFSTEHQININDEILKSGFESRAASEVGGFLSQQFIQVNKRKNKSKQVGRQQRHQIPILSE